MIWDPAWRPVSVVVVSCDRNFSEHCSPKSRSRDGVCIRTLVANISGCSDWIRAVSSLFDSPCLGLYRRKEISSIESLDAEVLAIKDRVRILENLLTLLTSLYHVIGDVLVPS